jgi:hypothetical protein
LYLCDTLADGVEHLKQRVAGGAFVYGILGAEREVEDSADG